MSTETGGLMAQTLIALAIVIGLILALAFWAKRSPLAAKSQHIPMKLISALALSPRERVVIVQVGQQWLILGHSAQGLSRLGEVGQEEQQHYESLTQQREQQRTQARNAQRQRAGRGAGAASSSSPGAQWIRWLPAALQKRFAAPTQAQASFDQLIRRAQAEQRAHHGQHDGKRKAAPVEGQPRPASARPPHPRAPQHPAGGRDEA